MSEALGIYGHPAAILERGQGALTADDLMTRAKKRAFDPSIFDTEGRAPFFWPAEISSSRVDSYFTRMAKTSLQNYAAEAEVGVAFQPAHNHRVLPLGGSLSGTYKGGQNSGIKSVYSDFYTVPGIRFGDTSTSDFIDAVRAGTVKDVSIGFIPGEFMCNICGRDMLTDWNCWHIPGFKYDRENKQGEVIESDVLCIADVENAHLSEVSAVYDGATPGAAILKAQHELDMGRIRQETVNVLETRYRVRLIVPQLGNIKSGERTMANETPQETPEQTRERESAELLTLRNERSTLATLLNDAEVPAHESLLERIRSLLVDSKDGRAYRADMIEEVLKQGVRARSEADFNKEEYRKMLTGMDLAGIKRMRDDFKAIGDRNFPPGRQTTEEAATPPKGKEKTKVETPRSAFRAR